MLLNAVSGRGEFSVLVGNRRHTATCAYCFIPQTLSVCLLSRLLKNECMELDKMLRVDSLEHSQFCLQNTFDYC